MKVGDICIVLRDKGRGHPKGTKVRIIIIGTRTAEKEPYYCQSTEGQTAYWYAREDLQLYEQTKDNE